MRRKYEITNKSIGSVKDAAELMGISTRHVNNLCKDGTLKAARFGRVWRVNLDEIRKQLGIQGGY
ncbi:MAG: helix-turn-helix domain-containing protein [Coriobacteriales bacterium]|nr:helix-turn-helix domain-containing protein [Coriobacteriales bacterium]